MSINVLIINGSYRENGVTDSMVDIATMALNDAGAKVETVMLRDVPIQFCRNCRHCTQSSGETAGQCVHNDDMAWLIEKIEQSDAFVLASPTNFSSVTAIFQRFTERLTVFGYWPWGQPAPKMRLQKSKKAIVMSSCAAPSLLGKWVFHTQRQLKLTARVMGAKVVGSINAGLMAQSASVTLSPCVERKIQRVARKLLRSL